jgi:diacylglycerol kinase (ATP)
MNAITWETPLLRHKGPAALLHARARRRALLILNPTAGTRTREGARRAVETLRALGVAVAVRETACRGDAERYAASASRADFDVVVAAGGDGTINEVANGLGRHSPPLAIVPLGTANVLASELGLPLRPEAAARVIAEAQPRPIYVGLANGRRFLQMAGAGFDACVVEGVSAGLKRRLGKGAYVWRTAVELGRYGFPQLRVELDGGSFEAVSVIVAKGRFYAGRFVAAPLASPERPSFQVVLFRKPGRVGALRALAALGLGRLGSLPEVEIRAARSVGIAGADGAPVQADGDVVGRLPVRIEIGAERLWTLRPPVELGDP